MDIEIADATTQRLKTQSPGHSAVGWRVIANALMQPSKRPMAPMDRQRGSNGQRFHNP